jgi:hypothetical protein
MDFKQHSRAGLIVSGIVLIAGLIVFKKIEQPLLWAVLVYLGAIFSDLDTQSIPSILVSRIGFVLSCIMLMLNKPWPPAIAGAAFFLIKSGKHRGFIHKWWLPSAFMASGLIWSQPACLAFGVGLIIHLMVDKISPLKWANWV